MLIGLREALRADGTLEIVGEVHDGREIMPLVRSSGPDVVLLDTDLPGGGGLEWLKQLRRKSPEVKVVMSSTLSNPATIQAAFRRGAAGYIVESINPSDLSYAIREAVEKSAGSPILADSETKAEAAGLTARELEVLEAAARGLSNRAIASELKITVQTVKFHLTSVYRKIDVANRTEAARWVLENRG